MGIYYKSVEWPAVFWQKKVSIYGTNGGWEGREEKRCT
jgi:hypothetical protein